MYRVIILLCALILVCGCRQQIDHGGRTPLVEVKGMFLYTEDLEKATPVGLSRDDSVLFAENYIRNWVEDALLWQNAIRNVPDEVEVEKKVEAYRRSLMLHLYQQALIDEQMDMEVRGHEIDSFYQSHTDLYRLEYPLAKGVYIKIPLKGKDVKKVQQWYKKSDQETLENLEKYSLQNAVDYLYFYDQWIKIEDIVKKLPVHVTDVSAYIKKFPDVEVKDTAFHYFLHVDSLLGVGELEPIEYATPKIREALLNIRRMELMKRLRYQLYEEAQADEAVTYYY